jgi:hypothetical protein
VGLSPDSGAAIAIIDSLKLIAPPSEGEFDPSRAPTFSVDRIMPFVSDSGLVLADVNARDSIIRLAPELVRAQLVSRRGRAFDQLVHVGWISSIGSQPYSQRRFARSPGSLVVTMGTDWFALTFVEEKGRVRLREVSNKVYEVP